jgi:hypothetical protein
MDPTTGEGLVLGYHMAQVEISMCEIKRGTGQESSIYKEAIPEIRALIHS